MGENISQETQEEKERRRLEDEALWKPAPPPFELSEEEIIKWRKKYYSEEGMGEEKEKVENDKKEKEKEEKDKKDKEEQEKKGKNEEEKEEKKHIDGEKMFVEEKRNVAEESKFVQENMNISEGIHASLPVAAVMAATNDEVFTGRVPVVEEICVQTRIAPKTSTESPAIKQKTPNSNSKQKKFSKDDLKSFRSNFANKQGVQEVVEPIYDDLVLPKNVQLKNGDNINKSSIQENETQLMQTKNLIKGEENGDQIVNNKMNTEILKEQETEHLADKSSGLIDIVQDFKDFSSLKRKPKVKPVEPDTAQTNSSDIKVENIPKEDNFQNEGKETSDERTENTTSLSVCVDDKKNKKISRVT